MKRLLPVLAAAALVAALPGAALSATHHEAAGEAAPAPATVPAKLADTKDALRGLWFEHIFWVRNVVVARLAGNQGAAKAAEAEVVANAKAIAGAVEPFYGKAASDQLFKLLAGHWGAISEYLDATRAGSQAQQSAAFTKLNANANDIATFLAGANPHWPVATLRGLLTAHAAHHVQQIQELHAGQYDAEARTWAAMASHMNVIADALASGLAAQFPAKFR
ncbi:MAG: hypothetical protein NAOJABEB_00803 [Steroidobacteraceae bacterium]|nr:hypothetical protein [Steroidobacteraceae bacterium]